jgi:hypothetical protein
MYKKAVESSTFSAVGYNAEMQVLEVQFKNGRIYQYVKVAYETYMDFMNSPSKGKFLHSSILGVYPHIRIA